MRSYLSIGVAATLVLHAVADETTWLSPVYNHIFQYELPIPPTKVKSYTYRNESTGNEIDFYDLDVKTFEQQIYPDLEPAQLAGYDGISPGPTFRITKGRESIVRVKNHSGKDISVHLHGAHSRAPFDGWAEDITEPGQYKDYCKRKLPCMLPSSINNLRLAQQRKWPNHLVS